MLDHILIVDERRLVREALAKIIHACGVSKASIACVENEDDAIEYAQFSPVSLLICADNINNDNVEGFHASLCQYTASKQLATMVLVTDQAADSFRQPNSSNKAWLTLSRPYKKQQIIRALFSLTQNPIFDFDTQAIEKSASNNLVAQHEEETLTSSEKATVLVVDDETSNIDVAAGNLRHIYRVMAAKSGEDALRIVASNKHNITLILLDIMMPAMDGYQVCAALKAKQASADIPVIFLSAKAQIDDIKHGFDLGAVDYITKPLNGDLLRARVATHIRLQQQKQALSAQITTLKENAKLREDIEKITQHDLKAPLNNILFETYRLADKRAANAINRAVNNVVNMVNNSLNLYKIEQGIYTFIPQATNINTLITDAINAVSSITSDKNINIALQGFDVEHTILAEPLLCLSIFNNLIKNAVEASPINKTITLQLSHQSGTICFQLTNDGVIPPEIRSGLFEKYTSSNHQTGVGLGTYSAKLMTQVQHGDINFEIINNQQTRFTVNLPAA
ncbi:hybrid sensor histidine kinase/response regulator [Colwellia chukchiensis]|uniref:hybrid sensor histidine kinase/response regulator n=1 Tax=Colwellia chukchiensis TaxID=641665 RepID=UPI001301A9CC|nr:response regulator [Colwellia chukchiensis]